MEHGQQVKLGFAISREDGCHIFNGKGAGVGPGFWITNLFISLIFGFVVVFVLDPSARTFPTGQFIGFAGLWMGAVFLFHKARSKPFKVILADNHLEIAGRHYPKEQITELLIRHGADQVARAPAASSGGFVVGGTGITGVAITGAALASNAASNIGAASGQAMRNSLDKRSYTVCLRYGAQVIPIAKYLKEDVAIALFNEISRAY